MNAILKKFLGLSAVALLGATPAAFASDDAEGSHQHQQQQKQLQAPAQQQQALTAQQQQQVQQSVAAIVRVPKDQSGQEVPQQAQLKLRIGNMAQQGTTKDMEAIWEEETIDGSGLALAQSANEDEANPEYRGWGFRRSFFPFRRFGFFNPFFYSYPRYNYYYYPRGYGYGYGRGYGYGGGYRCGYGYRC